MTTVDEYSTIFLEQYINFTAMTSESAIVLNLRKYIPNKLRILIFILFTLFTANGYAKTIKLGLVNPTPSYIERIYFFIENGYIELDNFEIIGIYHENQKESIEKSKEFIKKFGRDNISISLINKSVTIDSLFVNNSYSSQFRELFLKTDGVIFLGGDDIKPRLYGEKTFLTTEILPSERDWEISFLFHLIGGYQNEKITPLLEENPDYVILGICLGMQQINVATGGTLWQDIPFQIYKKRTFESVMRQDVEKQHKNYQRKLDRSNKESGVFHFHHVKIKPHSVLDYGLNHNPFVISIHHQSVKKLGKNFKVTATSMDKKVVEGIAHSKYRNVYGTQFHPDYERLYKQNEFVNSNNEKIVFSEKDQLFHKYFWKDFSNKLKGI